MFYQKEKDSFADGAGRILQKLGRDAKLTAEFEQVIRDVGTAMAQSTQGWQGVSQLRDVR